MAFLLPLGRPERGLLQAKLIDYGYPADLSPLRRLGQTLDDVAAARLLEELRDVVPGEDLARFDPRAAVAAARGLCEEIAS